MFALSSALLFLIFMKSEGMGNVSPEVVTLGGEMFNAVPAFHPDIAIS